MLFGVAGSVDDVHAKVMVMGVAKKKARRGRALECELKPRMTYMQ